MAQKKSVDPFVHVRAATLAHRASHGCGAYPYSNGALLSTLAGAIDARRILELGTALGYTALNFAHGAPRAAIDTVERDGEHVRLARHNIAAAGMDGRVVVHEGDFAQRAADFEAGYDLAFFDGPSPTLDLHAELHRLLRPRGLLLTANLNHGGTADAVCKALLDELVWLTAICANTNDAVMPCDTSRLRLRSGRGLIRSRRSKTDASARGAYQRHVS